MGLSCNFFPLDQSIDTTLGEQHRTAWTFHTKTEAWAWGVRGGAQNAFERAEEGAEKISIAARHKEIVRV